MAELTNHLYSIIYPTHALIASQLNPTDFGKHYAVGSAKHFNGKVVFVEVDTSLESEYLSLPEIWAEVRPHEDGTPKRTKFVSNYRVLENIPMDKFRDMYLVTVDGHSLRLEKSAYTTINEPGLIRIFQQLNPIQMLVASNLDQRNFGDYYTLKNKNKGCPKLCYTQIRLSIDEFERCYNDPEHFEMAFPNIPNNKLYECIRELQDKPTKKSKTISIASIFHHLHYKSIRHGFWIAGDGQLIFYPLPSNKDLREKHYRWYKSA